MENGNEHSIFDLVIDHEGQNHLTEMAKWAKLIAIMGLIMGLIIAFAGVLTTFLGDSIGTIAGMGGLGPYIGFFSIVIGLIYLYPSWLLLKYATIMPSAIKKNDQLLVNEAFKNLKSCFRFWGILALIILGFYAIAIMAQLFISALS
jgi:hypothetical protein